MFTGRVNKFDPITCGSKEEGGVEEMLGITIWA
jgi:hypothetical protein